MASSSSTAPVRAERGAAPRPAPRPRGRAAPSCDLEGHGGAVRQGRRVDALGAVLGEQAGHALHQQGDVAAGAADQVGAGARRVGRPALGGARLRRDQRGEGPGERRVRVSACCGAPQPSTATCRHRLAGQPLDRRLQRHLQRVARGPGSRRSASRWRRRSRASRRACRSSSWSPGRAAAGREDGGRGGLVQRQRGGQPRSSSDSGAEQPADDCSRCSGLAAVRGAGERELVLVGGLPAERRACRRPAAACWTSAGRPAGPSRRARAARPSRRGAATTSRAVVRALDDPGADDLGEQGGDGSALVGSAEQQAPTSASPSR